MIKLCLIFVCEQFFGNECAALGNVLKDRRLHRAGVLRAQRLDRRLVLIAEAGRPVAAADDPQAGAELQPQAFNDRQKDY